MQKNWIWIVIAVIVIGLLGYLFLGKGLGGLSTLGNTSLRSLLTANTTQTCTFDNGQSSGTIYVSAGRMRGDFAGKSDTTEAKSHMIISNDIAYVWIDGMNQGYRMPFESLSASSSKNQTGGIDADAKVAAKCGPWSSNDAVFSLPTDVSFNPVGAPAGDMMPTTSNQGSTSDSSAGAAGGTMPAGSYAAQQCAACASITDANAKAQCIASFDCPAQ
jgi:hypothetical protein